MSCYGTDGAPIPCGGYTIYNSYVTDPLYASYYLLAWTGLLGGSALLTAPSIYTYVRSGRWKEGGWSGRLGLYEDLSTRRYRPISSLEPMQRIRSSSSKLPRSMLGVVTLIQKGCRSTSSLPRWTTRLPFLRPGSTDISCHPTRPLLPFTFGTLFLVLLIPAFILSTLFPSSELVANPNRFGFLALASLPPLFLLSSKSSPIVWLTGQGWTAVNFLHRWLGRAIVLLVFLHAYFWTAQWVATRQVTEFLSEDKQVRGIVAFAFLLLIAISSAKPIRRYAYSLFFILHYVGIIGFLVYINKHTVYAQGYATYAIVAIYVLDIMGRLSSMRIRYVEVEAMEGGMTRIGFRGVHGGWRAGQHLSVRLFFSPPSLSIFSAFRLFEAHPFSIANAPSGVGVLTAPSSNSVEQQEEENMSGGEGLNLYVRACATGSWTSDLHETAQVASRVASALSADVGGARSSNDANEKVTRRKRQLLHMFALVEGPYGGLGPYVDFDEENVLLVAGGGGMSFILGVLDEIVGRRLRSGRGGQIQVLWAVRERSHVNWFNQPLKKILDAAANSTTDLSVNLRVYITCDPTLTTLSVNSPTAPIFPPSSSSASNDLPLPHTLLLYSRPSLSSLLNDTIDSALAPCGKCWPVCHCGDGNDGVCGNEVGGCRSTDRSRVDQEIDTKRVKSVAGGENGGEKSEIEEMQDILSELPFCCGKKSTGPVTTLPYTDSDTDSSLTLYDSTVSALPAVKKGGCCSPSPASSSLPSLALPATSKPSCGNCCSSTGAGCCSGAIVGEDEEKRSGPQKIRTGGLGVSVCGPSGMMRELRQAIAEVLIGKATRIGGISLHTEAFSL